MIAPHMIYLSRNVTHLQEHVSIGNKQRPTCTITVVRNSNLCHVLAKRCSHTMRARKKKRRKLLPTENNHLSDCRQSNPHHAAAPDDNEEECGRDRASNDTTESSLVGGNLSQPVMSIFSGLRRRLIVNTEGA